MNLRYAAKDAADVAAELEARVPAPPSGTAAKDCPQVHALRLLDADATREKILAAKAFLARSGPDDLVVVFLAGHGLLDAKHDYFFATHDIDAANPAARGVGYEELETLLDGLPARRKLLLMDTCHSGELDKEDAVVAAAGAPPPPREAGGVGGRGFGDKLAASRVTVKGLAATTAFEQLKEVFADVSRGSGAQVITSASGADLAYESSELKNGFFTLALLEGLRKGATGEPGGPSRPRWSVSKLRDYVTSRVRELSKGRQTPTARSETIEFDFDVD